MKIHIVTETDIESFYIKGIFLNKSTAEKYRDKLRRKEVRGIEMMLKRAKNEKNEFDIRTWQEHLDNTKNEEYIGSRIDIHSYKVNES